MNILFTFPFVFNPQKGGTERVTDILAKEFKRRGHKIFYLNMVADNSKMDYEFPGEMSFIDEHPKSETDRSRQYFNYLNDNQIDVVINQGGIMKSCNFFCETSNTKAISITVVHCDPMINYNVLFNEISTLRNDSIQEWVKRILRITYFPIRKRKLKKYLTNHFAELSIKTDYLCLLSDRFVPNLKSLCPSVCNTKIISIGNPNTYKIEKNELPKEKIVLFVGRMDLGHKKPDRMIRIWKVIAKRFPDWKLVMIGGGASLEVMKHQSLNIPNIVFTGFTDPKVYYKKASVLCMTSNYEGWPMVLAEAMAHGVVPMSYESYSAIHDILKDDVQIVSPFSIREYVEKLSTIMRNESLRLTLAAEGYRTVEQYTVNRIADKWEAFMTDKLGMRQNI